MRATGECVTIAERAWLLQLERQALEYFLDNQTPGGLMLDRQANHGPRRSNGWCSTAASGMGLIALALASAPPHRLILPSVALERLRTLLRTALEELPNDHGIMPHFIDSATGAIRGSDACSTIDSAWLIAGALWAAAFLNDPELQVLADRLFKRVDWLYWTASDQDGDERILSHGKRSDGTWLGPKWDRLNGETAFMYVLAAGANDGRCLEAESWRALQPFYGEVAGLRFNNADLGLFVFQYSLDLLDLENRPAPGDLDLWKEAAWATTANFRACRAAADQYATYRRCWGLSAGDGPGPTSEADTYRCYSPAGPIDGTAHLLATLASIAHDPGLVLDNLQAAAHEPGFNSLGRYGYSNINLDRRWIARDMVGIDAGAAVLALDNFLMESRVRQIFHSIPVVQRGLERLGFRERTASASKQINQVRQAS
jgi:hypothetical protein